MSRFGSQTTADEVVQALPDRVRGRTFLITGPSIGGLGAETALSLARGLPECIILVGRSAKKCQPTVAEIAAISKAIKTRVLELDLASFRSVRRAAKNILEDPAIQTIDVVINNAGVMALPLMRNENDYEMHFAANHLGHFLLSTLLLPKLTPKSGRIINVSSSGNRYSGVNWADVHFRNEKAYKRMAGYSQSKAAQVLYTVALSNVASKATAFIQGPPIPTLGCIWISRQRRIHVASCSA